MSNYATSPAGLTKPALAALQLEQQTRADEPAAHRHHHHHTHHTPKAPPPTAAQVESLDDFDPESSTAAVLSQVAHNLAFPDEAFWAPAPPLHRGDIERIRSDQASDIFPSSPSLSHRSRTHSESSASSSSDPFDRSEVSLNSTSSGSATLPSQSSDGIHEEPPKLSKRQQSRKLASGLVRFLKTPMGIALAVYGILVVFWGAALVLILMGAVPMPSTRQKNLWVEYCSQILNALFTITGIGLIPWRARDSYNLAIIVHFARRHRKRQEHEDVEKPERLSRDHNPLVLADQENTGATTDISLRSWTRYERALAAFCRAQKWYRPHETTTHRAFPRRVAIAVIGLNDANSMFQILLCISMWGWNMQNRPPWTTAVLIPLSFLCGIFAGLMIWRYGKGTHKVPEAKAKQKQQQKLRRPKHRLPEKWFFRRD